MLILYAAFLPLFFASLASSTPKSWLIKTFTFHKKK